ncbi:MAG: protein kinase, partial [Polyangiaceae bacterium]
MAEPRPIPPWEALERIGEGATSVVWRARHAAGGQLVALKLARADDASPRAVAREATLLARIARRWGPALLDAGAGFLATEWVAGSPVDPKALPARADRERLAAVVAHGVGRALEELHEAGIRHGDVKPQNVLRSSHKPSRDAAEDRGATLIDLGLAADVGAEALGGTPRYASPELRDRGEAGPAADLWALGLVLAEILDPAVAEASEPVATIGAWVGKSEPARWVEALLARAPGGRPSATWLASRA